MTTPSDAAPPSDRAKVVAWLIVDKDGRTVECVYGQPSQDYLRYANIEFDNPPHSPVPLVPEAALVAALADVERLKGEREAALFRVDKAMQVNTDTQAASVRERERLTAQLAAERSHRETAERALVSVHEDLTAALEKWGEFGDGASLIRVEHALHTAAHAPSEQSDPTPEHET